MANFHVNLAFSADTGKAKAQIQELQTLLSKIAYTGTTNSLTGTMQKDIQAASAAAKDLQFHLNNAFNTTTGKFDLSLLDRSLKTSKANITDLSTQLLRFGPEGQQAFMKLAQSISLADQPMFRISNRMKEFAVTMKNTVKWQLSSSMLHGFMGAIQSAYGYAKDLNKSLNDIRIVTGYNTDQMAQFVEQANKAAKALSTTTTDYTNASLIYFQQGLSDAEVAARTDITVKMANAVGQSAEVVSEQLTAIWNNFNDGSQSLEYYVDVMTALGAATASSSDEISEGLSKFAAVAGTVGLSYEYATAALATLTSNTRESADVVGNALKTLFARIQGLKLGETLDDGTDLNKYSAALESIGISIYDTNGGLKDMDRILDEMAAKWNTLSDTQQVALAQTVAGVRQYNQLIALMENWNNGDGDSFQANLDTIAGSSGALQKQADIYAESWEAAEKRVQTAAQGIFQSLLDDKFFISLTNGFATVLNGIDAFIDGAGGVKTVLIGIASVVTSTFAHKIPQALDSLRYNLEFITKGSQAAYDRIQSDMNKATQDAFNKYNQTAGAEGISKDSATGFAITQANKLTEARNRLALVSDKMSAAEKQMANTELALIEAAQKEAIALKEKNAELQKSIQLQQDAIKQSDVGTQFSRNASMGLLDDSILNLQGQQEYYTKAALRKGKKQSTYQDTADSYESALSEIQKFAEAFDIEKEKIAQKYNDLNRIMFESLTSGNKNTVINSKQLFGELDFNAPKGQIDGMINSIKRLMVTANETNSADIFTAAKDEIAALASTIPQAVQEATGLDKIFQKIASNSATQNLDKLTDRVEELQKKLLKAKIENKDFEKTLKAIHGKSIDKLVNDMKSLAANEEKAAKQARTLQNLFNNFNPKHVVRMSEAFGSLGSMLGSVSMLMNSLKSLANALSPDVDMTPWERVSAVIMGLSMAIPGAISILKSFGTTMTWIRTVNTASTAAIHAETIAQNTNTLAKAFGTTISQKLANSLGDENIKAIANIVAKEKEAGSSGQVAAAKVVEYLTTNKLVSAKNAENLARLAVKLGIDLETASVWKLIGALLKQVALWAIAHWQIMLVVSVIGLLVAGITALIASYESEAEALERINQELEQTKNNYDEAKNAVKEFEDAFNDYSEGLKALDDLEKGSKELSEALEENNKKARKLIETYKLFGKGDYSYGADGRIIINTENENYKAAQARLANRESSAEAAYYNKLIQQQQATDKKMLSDVGKEIKFNIYYEQSGEEQSRDLTAEEYDANNASHHKIQTYLNRNEMEDLSQAIDIVEQEFGRIPATAEELVTDIQQLVANGKLDGILDENGRVFKNLSSIITSESMSAILNVNSALGDSVDAINYFSNALIGASTDDIYYDEAIAATNGDESAAQAMLLLKNQLITSNEADNTNNIVEWLDAANDDYQSGRANNITDTRYGDNAESYVDNLINKYATDGSADFNSDKWLMDNYAAIFGGQTIAQGQNLSVTDMAEAYYAGKGYTDVNVVRNGTKGVTVSYTDANGERITGEEASDKDIQKQWMDSIWNYIVEQQTDKMAVENLSEEDFQAIASNIYQNSSDLYGANWSSAIATGIANGNQFDFSSIFGQLDEAEIADIRSKSPEELAIMFGLDPATMEEAGLGTAEQFKNGILAGLENWSAEDNANAINSEFEALAKSFDIDVDEFKEYRDAIAATNEELAKNPKLLNKLTLSYLRAQKGVKKMSDSFENWTDAVKGKDKDVVRYAKAMDEIKESYKDVFNEIDPEIIDNLSNEFLSSTEMMGLMEKALAGDEQAWNDWEAAVLQQVNATSPAFANMTESMKTKMNELTTMAANLDFSGLTPGADIKDEAFLAKLGQMEFATAEAAQAMCDNLSSVGVDAEIEEHTREVPGYSATTRQTGSYVINTNAGPVMYTYEAGGVETKDPHTETYYTLKGAKYNGRGTRPSTGSNSNTGGGGGGSKKPEKKNDSGKTRYHTLQNQLEDLSASYDNVAEAAGRAFGLDKLKKIDEEIKATDDLIAKQEEYIEAISADLPKDKAIMEAYYDKIIGGPTIEFDASGNIANYDAIQDAMYAKYNEMASQYNSDSEEWQQFEKQFEQMEQYLEQYEETYDMLRDEEASYQELLNQRLDLQLEKVQYSVELKLDISQDDLDIIEYQFDLLEDKAFASAERITTATNKANNLYEQMLKNREALEETLGLSLSDAEIAEMMQGDMSVLEGKTFTEDQIDAIKDYRNNLLDLNNELINIQKQVEEEVLATFNEWHEELDRGIEKFDHYGNILESYKNIIDIVGKDALGLDNENIAKLSEAQVNNSINRLKANKDAYESYQKSAEEAENKMKKAQEDAAAARAAGNEELAKSYDEDAEFWKETSEEMNESAREAQEELMDNWGNTLEAIVTQFEEAVERAIEAFNDAIYELGGLEGLSADFSRAKEDDDTYLDDYQKIYELSKLTRDINNKIDDTDNIAGKQKLKALLEDINKLQEDGVEMSQYDLEYLQATYDLRLAELELEEARNAKNTVRLQKDNEGNWSYVYTQNTDAVDSAQQKYEDALYAMQDLSTNYIDEMSEKLISTSQEMQEALAAVRVEDYASIEEYYAELDRIERLYTERMSKQQIELQKGLDNNKTLYNTDWLNYSEATGYKISKAEEFAQAFSNTMLGQLTNTDTVDAFGQLITSATTTLVSGLTTAATTYYQNIGLATEAAGSSITDFADLLEEDIEAIKSKSGEAASSVEDMATRMDTAMTDIIDKVAGWQEEYGREIDKIINKNLRVIETYNNMIKALSGASGKITISYDVDSTTSSPVDTGTTVPEGTAQAATGGYTGNWGSNEGKLAILHQRELILNELDTSNFLQALEITRQIMSVIDIQAKQASLGLGAITASTLKDEKPKEKLEQEVHITAEFPNVNNHYEIEEAFNTLINTASQYANRK